MSVEKPEVTMEQVIGAYLNYTPTYAETEQLRTDLRTMNHTLIRDSILECQKARKVAVYAPRGEKRRVMHAVYTRKVKELAALYPFLFTVENALRSFSFETYTRKFGDPFWWKIFLPEDPRDTTTKKEEANFPLVGVHNGKKHIKGQLVNPRFVTDILYCINKQLSYRQLSLLTRKKAKPEDFYRSLSFGSICEIIKSDYSLCPVGSLKKQDFESHSKKLVTARNEIFHGNPVRDRKSIYVASERILDGVGVHLGDLDTHLKDTSYTRFKSNIPRRAYHCTPPAPV